MVGPPIWKICSSNWILSPNRGENLFKKMKPPPIQAWFEKINLCPGFCWCYWVQSVWPTIRCAQIFTAPHSFQLPRLGLASTPFLSLQCEPGMLNPCLFIDLYMYRYVHIDIDDICILCIYIHIYIYIFNVTCSQFPNSEMQHNNSDRKNLSGTTIIGNHLGALERLQVGGFSPSAMEKYSS